MDQIKKNCIKLFEWNSSISNWISNVAVMEKKSEQFSVKKYENEEKSINFLWKLKMYWKTIFNWFETLEFLMEVFKG